jgi:hypothetical protein
VRREPVRREESRAVALPGEKGREQGSRAEDDGGLRTSRSRSPVVDLAPWGRKTEP